MPKVYGHTATGKIHVFMRDHARQGFTIRELLAIGKPWTRAQVAYALAHFMANGWVTREAASETTRKGARRVFRYQWKEQKP
jgi:hypothetical protein